MKRSVIGIFLAAFAWPLVACAGSELASSRPITSSSIVNYETSNGANHIADMVHLSNIYSPTTTREDVERVMGVKFKLYYAGSATDRFGIKTTFNNYLAKFDDWKNGIILFTTRDVGGGYTSSTQIMVHDGERYQYHGCYYGVDALNSVKKLDGWSLYQ